MKKPKKKKVIKAWAIATKKRLGFYYPASFRIEQKKSIHDWYAFSIMGNGGEAREYCKFLKRHGLDRSFKVVPAKIIMEQEGSNLKSK